MRVAIYGAGKVGRGLHAALRKAGVPCSLRAARAGLPRGPYTVDLLVITVRDRDVGPTAEAMVARGLVTSKTAVVHVAGALPADALAALRPTSAGVAQMHPMIAFANPARAPSLPGGHVLVRGDAVAVKRARKLASALGMRPRSIAVDEIAYHAAAGLVANGAAALAAAGALVLLRAGVSPDVAPKMLGPLLRSVAENVEALGLPGALTGPVRRGDAKGVEHHLKVLSRVAPEVVALYRALVKAQVPLARPLGDATDDALAAIERMVSDA